MAPFALPQATTAWRIDGARVPAGLLAEACPADAEGLATVDLRIEGARIAALAPAGALPADPALPVLHRPGLLLPCFVDAHTHLDKGHIWPRAPNPDGTFPSALAAVAADREARWTAADVDARMEFALACAYAHGTRAIRTHIDSVGPQTRISWPVLAAARARWAGRIDLQASPLFAADLILDEAHRRDVVAMVTRFGGCLGAVTHSSPGIAEALELIVRLADAHGCELDFHADETGDPAVNNLALIAQTKRRLGFSGRVLVGHCCTLTRMPADAMRRTIEAVAEAGIAVVSLPMCNMYLQDREGPAATPRWRGITALKELDAAGVPAMVASDNTRDPFYAYGDLDMAEVWRQATRIGQLDQPFGAWAEAVTRRPARALGLSWDGTLGAGAPADLVLFPARSLSEFMARPGATRTVIRGGRPIAAAPPVYAMLDHLQGLMP